MSQSDSQHLLPYWIERFINVQSNEFLCRVPLSYLQDRFNFIGLDDIVPDFQKAVNILMDFSLFESKSVPAIQLYGLIHARYIVSKKGIEDMCEKYQKADFGICPRYFCNGQSMLPLGLSDDFGHSYMKLYCPRCKDIYRPHGRCSMLDGAMFGTRFAHMFFMQLPHMAPDPPADSYIPRIFGFKVHESALQPDALDSPGLTDCSTSSSSTDTAMKNTMATPFPPLVPMEEGPFQHLSYVVE